MVINTEKKIVEKTVSSTESKTSLLKTSDSCVLQPMVKIIEILDLKPPNTTP